MIDSLGSLADKLGIQRQRLDFSRPPIEIATSDEPQDSFDKLRQELAFAQSHAGQYAVPTGKLEYQSLGPDSATCLTHRKHQSTPARCDLWEQGNGGTPWVQKTYLVKENASRLTACVDRIELGVGHTRQVFSIPVKPEPGPLRVTYDEEFAPPATPISALANPEGEIVLFRLIKGEYQPNYQGGAYAKLEKSFSYSLNPYVMESWEPYLDKDDRPNTVVVARQNVVEDDLQYPARPEGEPNGLPHLGNRLTLQTPLEAIANLQEVKVPLDGEKAWLQVPLEQFKQVAARFKGRNFELSDFLKELQSHSPG